MAEIEVIRTRTREVKSCPPCPPPACGCHDQPTIGQIALGLVIFAVAFAQLAAMAYGAAALLSK